MKADAKTEQEVMSVLQTMASAYRERDLQKMLGVMGTDADVLMYGTGADEKRVGIAEIQKQAERDWAQSESTDIVYDWTSVSAAGNVAWTASDCRFVVRAGGQEFTVPARLTSVLERQNGEWRVAQAHFSMPSASQEEGESF